MNLKTTMKALAGLFAPSGCEEQVREYCKKLASRFEVLEDGCGNLLLHKPGIGKRIAYVCGMDERGVFVSHREEDGRLRFCCLGAIRPEDLKDREILFAGGARGVVECDRQNSEQQWISLLTGDVAVGESGIVSGVCTEEESRISGCGVARGACCSVLLALKEQKLDQADVWFVFSALYQLGKKGALAALSRIKPERAFFFEPVCTTKKEDCSQVKMGAGVVVKLRDGAFMDHLHLPDKLEGCSVPYQLFVGASAELAGRPSILFGIPSVLLGIPFEEQRYFTQTVDVKDVQSGVDLALELTEAFLYE